jgi:hypothetical protein
VEDMNTFLEYLVVLALFGIVLLPALVGHARDRAIDRQLRQAARRSSTRVVIPSRMTVSPNSSPWSRPEAASVKAPCSAG